MKKYFILSLPAWLMCLFCLFIGLSSYLEAGDDLSAKEEAYEKLKNISSLNRISEGIPRKKECEFCYAGFTNICPSCRGEGVKVCLSCKGEKKKRTLECKRCKGQGFTIVRKRYREEGVRSGGIRLKVNTRVKNKVRKVNVRCELCDGEGKIEEVCMDCKPKHYTLKSSLGRLQKEYAEKTGTGHINCTKCCAAIFDHGKPLLYLKSKARVRLKDYINEHVDINDITLNEASRSPFSGFGITNRRGRKFFGDIYVKPGLIACTHCLGSGIKVVKKIKPSGRVAEGDVGKTSGSLIQASLSGDADSAFKLGVAYEKGLGVTKSAIRAKRYYEKAAAGGVIDAMDKMGEVYELGLCGVKRDQKKAMNWYAQADEARLKKILNNQ